MKFELFWKNPGYKIRPELRKDIECDYLIVGGGIAGLSTAYFLAKSGAKNIVLIEKNYIASGASGKAAGTLVLRGEVDVIDVIQTHGKKKNKIYWEEIHAALKQLGKIIKEEKIDCDAEPQDTLYCGFKYKTIGNIKEEYELEREIESGSKFLEGEELKKEVNTNLFSQGILSERHGLSVNPLKLCQNFSKVIEKYGVRIYENTAFLRATDHVAYTHHGDIRFKKMIMAIDADYPAKEIKNLKSTIVITRPLTNKELIQTGFIKKKILKFKRKKIIFDSKKNYDYFKVTKDNRLLVGYGNLGVHKKHKATDPHFPHLKQIKIFIKKLFPYLNLKIEYAWSGTFGGTTYYNPFPLVKFEGDTVVIAGAASQVVCFMIAKYIANKLVGKTSPLGDFFQG